MRALSLRFLPVFFFPLGEKAGEKASPFRFCKSDKLVCGVCVWEGKGGGGGVGVSG